MFAKRLAIMVKAGVPLLDSLRILSNNTGSRAASRIFSKITKDVERGQFLATSMKSFRNIFGDFAVNVIHVGETTGTLEENLEYLAEELRKRQELRRKVVGAMVYPVIVVTATLALSVLLTVFIFPKILPIFASFKFKLPLATRMLIFISGIFANFGIYILLGLVALIALFIFLRRMPGFRIVMDGIVLRVPIFGRLLQSYHMANFCRTLGLLLKSQILVVEATRIAGNTVNNLVYRKEIEKMAQGLIKGGKISTHLAKRKKIFPSIVTQMVAVGETTGNLSETLLFVAELYEKEVDMITKNLSTTLEPALMIMIGALVGFIAISIITPIYEVTQYINP